MNRKLVIMACAMLLLALGMQLVSRRNEVPPRRELGLIPLEWKGWRGTEYAFEDRIVANLGVDEYIFRSYRRGEAVVDIYVGYYRSQREGDQIHSPKNCLPGGGWLLMSQRVGSAPVEGIGPVKFVEAVYSKGSNRQMFVYWYRMKGAFITNEYMLKLHMMWNLLRYRRNDAAFVRLSSSVAGDGGAARADISAFMADFLPLLGGSLPE